MLLGPVNVASRWTRRPIAATLSPMADETASGGTKDDKPEAAEREHAPAAGAGAGESSAPSPDATRHEPARAEASSVTGGAASDAANPTTASKPVNMVHEWAAAIAIMVVLAAILGSFIWFLRGASM